MSLMGNICTFNCVKEALFGRFEHFKMGQMIAFDQYLHTDIISAIFLENNFQLDFDDVALAITGDFRSIF